MRHAFSILILTAAVISLWSPPASAAEVETEGPLRSTPVGAFFYNTTGITIGQDLWLYHQGDDGVEGGGDPNCFGTRGDQIIAYRARITNGIPGAFERVGRISPEARSPTKAPGVWPPACIHPPASFGPGQIFRATTPDGVLKYHMLVDVSDTLVFKTVWRGESIDGLNWTWYLAGPGNANKVESLQRTDTGASYAITSVLQPEPFMEMEVPGYGLLKGIVVASHLEKPGADWWGFLNYVGPDGVIDVTGLRIDFGASGTPIIRVLRSTSPHWRWRTLSGGKITVPPANVLDAVDIKTLHEENGKYQLWGGVLAGSYGQHVGCDTSTTIQCTTPGGCATGDGSVVPQGGFGRPFWLNTGAPGDTPTGSNFDRSGFAWWYAGPGDLGPKNRVFSLVRPLPSGYGVARLFPFRWNSPTGKRYLFSTTNDENICNEFLFSPFWKMYVVRTALEFR